MSPFQPGDRVRFVRDVDGRCGPLMRAGQVVTVRRVSTDAAGFAVLVDDGDPTNGDMLTNGHTVSDWFPADCFEKETT